MNGHVAIMELQMGAAAPVGTTTVWHNGKQYAITDGTWTGSTFIPASNSMPYPSLPVDFSQVYAKIDSLAQAVTLMQSSIGTLHNELGLIKEQLATKPEPERDSDEWNEKWQGIIEALGERFDDVDRALRLVMDE